MLLNKIKSDAGILIIGNLLNAFYLWSITSILARKFDVGLLGQYTLSLSIITPIFCFVYFGFRILLVTDTSRTLNIYRLFKLKSFLTAFFFLVSIIVYLLLYKNKIYQNIFYFVLIYKSLDSYYDFFIGVRHRNDEVRKHGIILIVRSISLTIVFFIGSYLFESYNLSFLMVLFSSTLLLYYFELKAFPFLLTFKQKIDNDEIITVFTKSLPIVSSAFVNSILVNIPNYYISYFYNSSEVGLYAIFYSFNVILNIVLISLGQYYLRDIAKSYNTGDIYKIKKLLVQVIFYIISTSIIAFFAAYTIGDHILKLLFGADALYYAEIFPYLFLFSIPIYIGQIMSYIVTGVAQLSALLVASSASLIISLLFGYILIAKHPIWGAFITLLLVGSTQTTVFIYYLNRSFQTKYRI